MSSHRLREPLQPERVRVNQVRASTGGARNVRQSWDAGGGAGTSRSAFGRSSRTPSKGNTTGSSRSTFGGRMSQSRTPLKSRLSSLAKGPDAASTTAVDPRDIKNKTLQSTAISDLIDFLAKKGFNQPLSRRVLSSPSTKEFMSIFEFVVQCYLPGYEISASGLKPEQEIYNLLRDLGYRFTLNKQHLATIGAPHTWPYALAALDWLRGEVELHDHLENAVNINRSLFELDDENLEKRKGLYRRNESRMYSRYLNGEDEPDFAEFKSELDELMMKDSHSDVKEMEELRDECQQLDANIDKLKALEPSIIAPQQRLDAAKEEELAREDELAALKAKLAELKEETAASRRQREATKQKRAETEETANNLALLISKQTVRKEDVNRIIAKRQELQVAVAYQERVKFDLMEASGGDERRVAELLQAIEPQAIALRRAAGELGIVEGCPELQIGAGHINNPDSFVPQLRTVLQSEEEGRKKAMEEERLRLDKEAKTMDQVTEELWQTVLQNREQREQFDLLEQEVSSMQSRLHAQEEGLMAERVAWDKKLFALRNQAADLEKQLQLQSERVRHGETQLRRFKEEASHVVKEKEDTCRALSCAALDVLETSQEFGEYLRGFANDFK